jgi:hypothetical protein
MLSLSGIGAAAAATANNNTPRISPSLFMAIFLPNIRSSLRAVLTDKV